MKKYWIAVISLEHAKIASENGFIQVCHGKEWPLKRVKFQDEIFIYSPKTEMRSGVALKQITFHGLIKNDLIYQVEQYPGFHPYRKEVSYNLNFKPIYIKDVYDLNLTKDPHWGMLARRGIFEISYEDAEKIKTHNNFDLI